MHCPAWYASVLSLARSEIPHAADGLVNDSKIDLLLRKVKESQVNEFCYSPCDMLRGPPPSAKLKNDSNADSPISHEFLALYANLHMAYNRWLED